MSMRYPGGLIATSPVNARYPSGVWTQAQAIPYQAQNVWTRDQFWPNTTLLLQGDGAVNGAQNNTFLDSSSNNFTITRNGNTTQGAFTPYEQDGYWSNYFDGGTSTRLTLPSNTAFAFGTGAYTIEGWVYLNAQSASQASFFEAGTANGALSTSILNTGAVSLGTYGVGAIFSSPANSISPNQWYHIAIVRNSTASNDTKIYVNGSAVATGTDSSNWTVTTTPAVGGINLSGYTLNGYVSNLRVVKGTAVYTANFTPPAAPLTAITNTSLLTCQSNRFKDNSTNAFAITVNGSPSVQSFQPFPGATTYSGTVLGGSGYFDGSGDWLSIPDNAALKMGSSDFTYECWLYPTSIPNAYQTFIEKRAIGGYAGVLLAIKSSGKYSILVASGVGTWGIVDESSISVILNQWQHLAVVRSGSNFYVYLNGTRLINTTIGFSVYDDNSVQGIGVGSSSADQPYFGYINDVRIVKGTAVYTAASFTPPTAPLTAITNTSLLTNFTNAGIYDNSMMNNLETVGNAQVSTSVVKYGTGSMAFDGSGDYLLGPSSENYAFRTGDFTVECWVYITANQSFATLIDTTGNGGASASFGWLLEYSASRGMVFFIGNSGAGTTLTFATTPATGVWTHLAATRSGSTLRLFINGTSVASGTYTNDITMRAAASVSVGAAGGNQYLLNGYIDDLRITKGAARYITNFTPPPARMPGQ